MEGCQEARGGDGSRIKAPGPVSGAAQVLFGHPAFCHAPALRVEEHICLNVSAGESKYSCPFLSI